MAILYWDSTIKKGNTPSRLAKLAPAPRTTKSAGSAQQINVEVEANSEKKLAALSCILFAYQLDGRGVKAVVKNILLNASAVYVCLWGVGQQDFS